MAVKGVLRLSDIAKPAGNTGIAQKPLAGDEEPVKAKQEDEKEEQEESQEE